MVLIVDEKSFADFAEHLNQNGEKFYKIGRVVEGEGVKISGGVFSD